MSKISTAADRLKVGIIGGSITGCAAAIEMIHAGHEVQYSNVQSVS